MGVCVAVPDMVAAGIAVAKGGEGAFIEQEVDEVVVVFVRNAEAVRAWDREVEYEC